jgi:hypothetical protein
MNLLPSNSILNNYFKPNPPIVVQVDNLNDKYKLVLGELSDDLQVKIVEDEEEALIDFIKTKLNSQLSWWLETILHREFHSIRVEQYGPATKGIKKGWSLKDSAEELKVSTGLLSENIRLANTILSNPNLKKITNRQEAIDKIFPGYKRERNEISAKKNQFTEKILEGNTVDILSSLKVSSFDCCILDTTFFIYEELERIYITLKDNSFIYIFCNIEDFSHLISCIKAQNLKNQRFPLVWLLESELNCRESYKKDYNLIIVATKGNPVLTETEKPSSVFSGSKKNVIKKLIYQSTYTGSLVLNPFAEDDTVAEVCKETGRNFVVIKEK